MKNNKLLLATSLLAASSLSLADYTEQQIFQVGEASLSSIGSCKLKRTKFPGAKYGLFIDNGTQEVFEGVLSSDNKLLAKFAPQSFTLTDIKSSTASQDYQQQTYSHLLQPESLNYLSEQNNCSFATDATDTPIIQTNPAQNVVKLSTGKFRKKTSDWSIKHQVAISINSHATTPQEKNCSSAINCTRTGLISTINFSFKHKSAVTQPNRLLELP